MAVWAMRTATRRPNDEEQSSAWFQVSIAPSLQNPVENIASGGTVGGQWSIPRGHGRSVKVKRLISFAVAFLVFGVLAFQFGAGGSAFAQEDVGRQPRTVRLAPEPAAFIGVFGGIPGGTVEIYESRVFPGAFTDFFPEYMVYNVRHLACRTAFYTAGLELEDAAREFYAIYLTIGADLSQRMRVQTFNTDCNSAGDAGLAVTGDFSSLAWLQDGDPELPLPGLFTDQITIEVFLETDDGQDAPQPGDVRVFIGTDPAPAP